MYALDLICSNGHEFESWFQNRNSFERQQKENLITCPFCGDVSVKQVISPVRIGRHQTKDEPIPQEKKVPNDGAPKRQISKFMEIVEKHFEDVGKKFPEEAVKMHYGETERRSIRGTATADEEKELKDEGIPFLKIPDFQ